MRELPVVDPARHAVFTAREARAAGWSYDALCHAERAGRLARLDRGLYVPVIDGEDPDARRERFAAASVAAALAARPAVASHRSAAVLAGLPVWTLPKRACVTVRPRYTGDARHGHLHRATLRPDDVLAGVVARTRAARTVTDIARECGIEQAVVVGDAALARRMTDHDQVARSAAACAGWPGSRRAATVLGLLDGRSESPLESVSRLRLWRHGIPPPEPQTLIFDLHGHFLGRVDLYWDEYGVVGEVDGTTKLRDAPERAAYRWLRRQGLLEEAGLIVVRWGRADLETMPWLAARLTDAFRRGAARPSDVRRWTARPTERLAPCTRAG